MKYIILITFTLVISGCGDILKLEKEGEQRLPPMVDEIDLKVE